MLSTRLLLFISITVLTHCKVIISGVDPKEGGQTIDDCVEGEFLNSETQACEECRECADFMYIRKECTALQNTQCGWCGSKTVVENADFEKKCEPWKRDFSMFTQLKKRIQDQMEAAGESSEADVLIKDTRGDTHILEINIEKDDYKEEEQEDESESASDEYDEVEARKIVRNEDYERLLEFNEMPVIITQKQMSKVLLEESEPVIMMPLRKTRQWMNIGKGAGESADDDYESAEQEIVPMVVNERNIGEEITSSQEEDEAIEELLPRDAMDADVPIRIIVTGERARQDWLTYERLEEEERQLFNLEEQEVERRDRSVQTARALFFLSVVATVYCLFRVIRRRQMLRHRFISIPPTDMLSKEQKDMIERCAKNVKKAHKVEKCPIHGYDNQLAYV